MTDDNTQSLILVELQSLREDFNGYARQTGERLSTLESQMCSLCGNGQPGRIAKLEKDVDMLTGWRWWVLGGFAVVCTFILPACVWLAQFLIR